MRTGLRSAARIWTWIRSRRWRSRWPSTNSPRTLRNTGRCRSPPARSRCHGRGDEAEKPAFTFVWRETGGPAVVAPSREGFGTRVIKTSLADDFGGTVELAYEPAGFVCTLTAPLENLPRLAVSL